MSVLVPDITNVEKQTTHDGHNTYYVQYSGMSWARGGLSFECKDTADHVSKALRQAHQAGRQAAKREIREALDL